MKHEVFIATINLQLNFIPLLLLTLLTMIIIITTHKRIDLITSKLHI